MDLFLNVSCSSCKNPDTGLCFRQVKRKVSLIKRRFILIFVLITKASVILKSITVLLFIIQKEENLEGFSLEICWSNKDLSATQRVTAKTRERKVSWDWPWERVLNRFYWIRDFPYLKIRIRDLRTRSRRDSVLKVRGRVRMHEIPLGITWLHEILSRDYGIEGPYWGPSWDGSDFQTQLFVDIRRNLLLSINSVSSITKWGNTERILFNHFKLYLFSTISMAMLPNTDVSKNLVFRYKYIRLFTHA